MQLSHAAFNDIRKVVHNLCGIVISDDKQYLIKTRLESIVKSNGLPSYEALVQRLAQPVSLLLQDQVIEAITTKETSFNRDGHPFDELRRTILAELAEQWVRRKATSMGIAPKIRIWCAAASTGQEVYSVTMAIADFLASRPGIALTLDDFSILASDISTNALAIARQGRYSAADLGRGITLDQRERYFRQDNEQDSQEDIDTRGEWIRSYHIPPEQRRTDDKGEVLTQMDGIVVQCGVIEARQVPHPGQPAIGQ